MNFKDTKYYKSDEHIRNALTASKLGSLSLKALKNKRIDEYERSPSTCAACSFTLEYKKRNNKFCSSKCAASINNKNRIVSDATKKKTSLTIKAKILSGEIQVRELPVRDKIVHHKICKVCHTKFSVPARQIYTKTCSKKCRTEDSELARCFLPHQ